eukprot:3580938-Amphidinium_carterae.1
MAKHVEEVDKDVASHTASQPRWTSRARLRWRKTKTGRRRACRIGSGGTRSNLPTIHEVNVCDAFLEIRAVCGLFWEVFRTGKVSGVPKLAFIGSELAEDRENAVGVPGFSKDREADLETKLMGVSEAQGWGRGETHPPFFYLGLRAKRKP